MYDPVFSRFSRTPICDGQTHTQTQGHSIYSGCIASRGKICSWPPAFWMSRETVQYGRDGRHEHTSLIIDVLCFCTSLQNRKSRKLYLVTKKLPVALPTEARNILKLSPGRTVLHSKSDQLRIKLNHKNEHNISNISIIIQFTMFVCRRSPC